MMDGDVTDGHRPHSISLGDRYFVTMGPAGSISGSEYRVPLNEVLHNPNTSPEDLVTLTDVLLTSFGQYSDSRREISSKNVKFQCNHCGKHFTWKHQVTKHLGSHCHDNEIIYICYECGKMYPRPENLNRHTSAVHRYIRHHACPECGQGFGRASEVDIHRKEQHPFSIVTVDMRESNVEGTENDSHPGKRRKSRDISDEEDEEKMSESSESEADEENEETKCKKCGQEFHRAAQLKRHMRLHPHDKQFECPFSCGRSYTQLSYLCTHIAVAHDDVVHKCTICGKFFETELRLENHTKTHTRTRAGRQRRQDDDTDWRPHT